ncbi:TIGR01459 family HAD-type hydrolase [Candidatus Phycosocius spiralis]|uniref:Haloacid dehalogenase n=1 Tax=Candidatus Phycosocius spiralis TaxID=2815099 RepID=A0ABQ4PUQ3_9PROT|nr:TIGR01459 family HAD-type hydrolase [Candidatus Phycosocius spiralis]GIU66706.1 haloacid dehalogenase [Candidatus Phycosocius spiralis]
MTVRIISALAEISDHYDAVLCDVWGVIHNGRTAYQTACDALAGFRADGKPVILISNAPRPSLVIPNQLKALGVRRDSWDGIVTSGDATRAEIQKRGPRGYKIGPSKDEGLYDGLPVDFQSIETADYVICTGLRDELHESPDSYREELLALAARNLPFICANPDRVVKFGGHLIPCAGALADIYEEIGGPVIMAGKPYAPIYELALAKAHEIAGSDCAHNRILCIGDGVQTDVAGAFAQKLDCLFVSGGIHATELSNEDGLDAQKVEAFMNVYQVQTRWAMGELA